jgi:conjugal transfer pilus assembly protein TraK
MSSRFYPFLCSLFFLHSSLKGAILHSLDELRTLEVPISKQGLTRITVENDRIQNVFGVKGEYVLEADETKGQVFIRPTISGKDSLSLTLTTEGGSTQDLRLILKDKVPETLILTPQDSSKEDKDIFISHEEVEALIQAAQAKRIPVGYELKPNTIIPSEELLRKVSELRGKRLRCFTYTFTNTTQHPIVLRESSFAKSPKTIAVLVTSKTLKPQEGTTIYVVKRTSH